MRIGVYPGTFDPITNGHLDIIKRAAKLFDKVIVVVPINMNKKTMFSVEERMELIKESVQDIPNIEVDKTSLLTVDYAKKVNATAIIRGLRMVSDFEYELQMAAINKSLDKNVETIFIMSSHEYSFLSSSSVKELVGFNGNISEFVPEVVKEALYKKYQK
ncbi:MAG: pantetheine-phosphate adenylyltransferase [Bacilli bacterium]|nr:pantetheine-phosphate adenylyltransferase [Bacilli bacterium]